MVAVGVAGMTYAIWPRSAKAKRPSKPRGRLTREGLAAHKFNETSIKRILDVEGWVEQYAAMRGLDPDLVNGVIWVESGFNPNVASNVGAKGLMQLMPGTQKEWEKQLGVSPGDGFNPRHNIMLGTHGLRVLLDKWKGDLRKVLGSYNWGSGNVSKSPDQFPESVERYVQLVEGAQRRFTRARAASKTGKTGIS